MIHTRTVELDFKDIKITLLGGNGEPLEPDSKEASWSLRWLVEGPGIDSTKVKRVKLPELDYTKLGQPLIVAVEMYITDN